MVKEKFRSWNTKGNIKVKYKDGDGNFQVWEKNQEELLNKVVAIADDYAGQDLKLTNRQLYYQLVSAAIIPNADEIYKRICKFLTDARYAGMIDWEAIEDRGRVPDMHAEWANIKQLISSAVYSYRLPRWKDQDTYVELYCEKQAMESVLKPVADKYHIYFGCNKGYSSATMMYDLAQRIIRKMQQGKKCAVLYLGDHDSSGLDMIRDIKDRIGEFVSGGANGLSYEQIEKLFDVIPLALTTAQVRQYNPPPNPAKITDPRAKKYIAEYGKFSWELDALKPEILIKIAEEGILKWLDLKKYNGWIEKEETEKQALKKFGEKMIKGGKG